MVWNKAATKNSTSTVIFCEGKREEVDLALLSLADHSIITVGTFSWWAGWLAGGNVIYYGKFPRKDSRLSHAAFSTHLKDYYPQDWIPLS